MVFSTRARIAPRLHGVLPACGEREQPPARVGGVGAALDVAERLELRDRLGHALGGDPERRGDISDRPRSGHEHLEEEAVGVADLRVPRRLHAHEDLRPERLPREQDAEHEVVV